MTAPSLDTLRGLLSSVSPTTDWSSVGPDTSLEEAGLDSLDKATFVMKLEEETGREIPDDAYERLDTMAEIQTYLAT